MLKLVVDAGNTSIKVAVFDGKELIEGRTFLKGGEEIGAFITKYNISKTLVSSVLSESDPNLGYLKNLPSVNFLSYKSSVPLQVLYTTPETLGMDRLAAAVGGSSHFPQSNVLIIDAGTCIKYDMVNSNKIYLGGAISPGISMRLKALNEFTGKLPLVKAEEPGFLIGDSTKKAILSGVINAAVFEMEGFTEEYRKRFPSLKVLLTGGDSIFFDKKLKNSIFAVPDLVLKGLNEILDFNVK